jgi:glutamate dehydrogenase
MDYNELARMNGLDEEDIRKVEKLLIKRGNFTREAIQKKINGFFGKLGIGEYYFQTTPIPVIARHMESLRAAEIIAENSKSPDINVDIRSERKEETLYFVDDTLDKTREIERRIDHIFKQNYRLQCYRTSGKSLSASFLRLYFVSPPRFHDPSNKSADFKTNMNIDFLETSSKEALSRYQKVYEASRDVLYPYVEISEKANTSETRIMVSLPPNSSEDFLSKFSEVMTNYDLFTTRKYVEPMRDGRRIFTFYLFKIERPEVLENLKEDISLISLVGKTPIDDLFIKRTLTAREYLYACCLTSFTHQFIVAHTPKIEDLEKALTYQPELHGIVRFLKLRLVKDTYTYDRICETVRNFPEIIRNLYRDFQNRLDPNHPRTSSSQSLDAIMKILDTEVHREVHKNIIHCFLGFNQFVLKTNFFKKDKIAISFRMSSEILDKNNYPDRPYGIFFILGREMLGFHVRFEEIARGGVRIVRSRTEREFDTNAEFVFDEIYRLAHTQQQKNKDIPEGGSKGIILLGYPYQNLEEVAFKKYVDALLDLMLPDSEIVDYHVKKEILFLGPDEGTAGFMDWASQYARYRRYPFWRSFTTGKTPEMGGIPHDLYGMTTAGVYEYEQQILKQLGLKEKETTKIQTGGPDGDLGSNEIKFSKSRYLAVMDASGVLYDKNGIDRNELARLAKARKPVRDFNRAKLSAEGFLVLVEDKGVRLFDGRMVANGTEFRNYFHLSHFARADLFIPCGGRPQSINILNWKQLLNDKGEPAYKVIVEGANLFITQEARLELEKRGCIVIKDASANKGGVTSSSLEVLASLALNDEEFDTLFCVKGRKIPVFRIKYIDEVMERIRRNASSEFGILWREHQKKKVFLSILSDQLSLKINNLSHSIFLSDLWNFASLRENIISRHVPVVLLKRLGIEEILKRIPESYQRALFSSILARDFVYSFGIDTTEVEFAGFLDQMGK